MKEIMIASKNVGKINEYRSMLTPLGYRVFSLIEKKDAVDIEETGKTFSENAMIKAVAVSDRFHMPCLADDSGLEVLALGGAPGVHSQRYSKEGTTKENNKKLIANLQGKSDRRARFVCAIVFYSPERGFKSFEGSIDGEIIDTPMGHNGFGYDPHFYLPEFQKTMAELPIEIKNSISHRGRALRQLMTYLSEVSS
jgi:XTP/dITP diphosphohydrolase